MGLIVKKYIADDCLLGLWDITEDFDTLYNSLNIDEEEQKKVLGFKNENRRVEWLSVRALLSVMTGDPNLKIVYNAQRKPFLSDSSFNISISHSRNLTSILLSKDKLVGIDLEFMSHKKIHDLAFRFINEREVIINGSTENQIYHTYIHWCAKEALYKICDKQGISFRDHLTLEPFQPADEGQTIGIVENNRFHEHIRLNYFRMDNYIIVWCCK
jgi:4'-phosphopantetheinyl transferase